MDLKQQWSQLPGRTKMFIVGGGIMALFFLYTAIKNKNNAQQSQQQTTQDTSTGPQQLAVDPTSWIDAQNQQMQQMQQLIGGMNDSLTQYQQSSQQEQQQNMQSMQDLIKQNQQATQQQIQSLNQSMATPPAYNPVPVTTAPPIPVSTIAPAPTPVQVSTPAPNPVMVAVSAVDVTPKSSIPYDPVVKSVFTPPPAQKPAPVIYTASGTKYSNSSIWGMSQAYLENHGTSKPTNAQIQQEVNHVVSINNVKNPNVIAKGTTLKMN